MAILIPLICILGWFASIWRFGRRVLRDWAAHRQRPQALPTARALIERHARWLRRYGDALKIAQR